MSPSLYRALRLLVVLGPSACACYVPDARVSELVPDRDSFAPVAQVLVRHCGSLDCHGSSGRNLRIYGNEGLRWSKGDRPLKPACTTELEVEQDYRSTVGLEPELISAVVSDDGAKPERLSLIRKARGLEQHKGGAPIVAGDTADRCLTSWLRSETDRDACLMALPMNSCF